MGAILARMFENGSCRIWSLIDPLGRGREDPSRKLVMVIM